VDAIVENDPDFREVNSQIDELGRRIQRGMLEESVLAAVRLLLNVKLRDVQGQDSNDPREFAVVSAARARRGRRQAVGDLSSIDEMARYATATLSQNDSNSDMAIRGIHGAILGKTQIGSSVEVPGADRDGPRSGGC
jgi:hypothetical protein